MIREINYDYATLGISTNQTTNSIKMFILKHIIMNEEFADIHCIVRMSVPAAACSLANVLR